jgi:GrpB-like predicted nucleotidyltransferase (UPF0157 family)
MGFRLIGGPEGGRVRLSPYRPEWAERFAAERERIAAALGPVAERIEHVGSTSVPGLDAKPIVDILVAVADPADPGVGSALETAGYVLRVDEEGHRLFRTPERDVHVHLWVAGTPDVTDHIAFRDRLRASEADRRAYGELKHRLAAEREWDDINDYAEAKGALIGEILARARAG